MGWLTVQPESATIKTTPIDRLATIIAGAIMEGKRGWRCDNGHMTLFILPLFQQPPTQYSGNE